MAKQGVIEIMDHALDAEFENKLRDRYTACLLGGAIGDALGAAVEFMPRTEILSRFGPDGITDYAPAYGSKGRITADTQMTLFTAEGLCEGGCAV
jgi:ADP-ribosylglycohydrolase